MTKQSNRNLMSRRRMLKIGALGAAAVGAPWIVRDAFSSSGELNYMAWAGYDFTPVFEAFTKATGIKMNAVEQPEQDTMMAQAQAARGQGLYDIIDPSVDRVVSWVENDLVQPWNEANLNLDAVEPGLVKGGSSDLQVVDGKRYGSPSVWGTEAITFSTKDAPQQYGKLSLISIWSEEYQGKVTVRPHSALAAIGRVLEAEGKLPKPFRDSYKDEATMRANWDVIIEEAKKYKKSVAQFWKDENTAQGAFRTNGCVIGLTWDTSARALVKEELPFSFLAPKEGCFAWLQSYMLFKDAKNIAQAEEWVRFVNTAQGSALLGKGYGANPAAKGAVDLLDSSARDFFKAAYPGDALERMWWWPTQASWYLAIRNEYADRFQAL